MTTTVRAEARLDALYATLPVIACQRKCQEACGPIVMSRVEWERIITALGFEPKGDLDTLTCPMLSPVGTCNVYAIRPLICRLWGLVEAMRCPWGCVPDRWIARRESYALLDEAERIGA